MTKLTPKEFNKKYKISQELQDKFDFVAQSKRQNLTSIAGKPKKLAFEIVKRFFTNPAVVIALLVFIALVLCSILIPFFARIRYGIIPNKPLSELSYTDGLPPINSPYVLKAYDGTNNPFAKLVKAIAAMPSNQRKYFDFFISTLTIEGEVPDLDAIKNSGNFGPYSYVANYNAYAYYQAQYLWDRMTNAKNEGLPITDALIESIKSKLPNLRPLLGTFSVGSDVAKAIKKGSDVWITTWYATWRAIKIALIVATIQTVIGVSIGAYLGFHAGKKLDTILMRIIDIFLALPELIWLLLFISIFGTTQWALIGALIITGWAGPVSATRMFIITVKDEEYIVAAKSIGASTTRQVFSHALPAIIGKVATNFVRRIPSIIVSVASLAFLGFFQETEDVNLGQLLIASIEYVSTNLWILLLPAIILLSLSLSLHFIAVGVHDALDPKVIRMSNRKR
ncbi:ABC transporter permease [Metamycoplasma salivarium]|uniref:ABC transporter permease n=1 Tax=Metamycoplasma salivarium TaxID=2124 RepID=UPI001F30B865|nr:ABC transporter permease [Metamycoplasma salivarium]GIZ06268.1 hypothetical protein MSATCC23557_2400 [Metamycoplasma salivarium]